MPPEDASLPVPSCTFTMASLSETECSLYFSNCYAGTA